MCVSNENLVRARSKHIRIQQATQAQGVAVFVLFRFALGLDRRNAGAFSVTTRRTGEGGIQVLK
jgi:hypothetical protein